MAKILVAHDDATSATALSESLEHLRHTVREVEINGTFASSALAASDLIFLSLSSTNLSGLAFLKQLQQRSEEAAPPVVVITGQADSEAIIETMKCGAFDHLIRPVASSDLQLVVSRALARPKDTALKSDEALNQEFLVGLSPVMRQVQKLIGISAACDTTVLISGETGAGKGTVASSIHRHSRHRSQPLTVVDCTAIPEDYQSFGCLLPGSSGTVLLDEIGDLNTRMQALLVRSLKESPAEGTAGKAPDIRIIAITQYDLINMVKEKRFREDLYYRLSVLPVPIPPLRERGSDILALAETFLQQASPSAPKQLSTGAAKALLDYGWPGNVRELQNLMYHLNLTVRSSLIEEGDLAPLVSVPASSDAELPLDDLDYNAAVAALEKHLLARALKKSNGNRTDAARILGINRQLLYAKLKEHKLGQ